MLNSILANVIAGLGLFFSGLRMVDASLRQSTGRRLRSVIGRLTGNFWVAGGVGLATGALVQSSSGIVFMLVSLVTSGLTTVRRALPIVTWANVGCCALIFVAVLDLRLAILYLVGLAGAAFAFDQSHRNSTLGAVFGIGMLFYGIELMKLGAEPLKTMPWFAELLDGRSQSLLLTFVGGAGLSFVTQSSTAVSILAIGLVQTGLLGPFPTMMALYGANVGSTFARMLLSSALKGSVRQLTAYQDLFKITGAVLFVPLLYLEALGHVPLVRACVAHLSSRIDRQMALVFLLFNLTIAVLFTALQPLIVRALEYWLPADVEEDLSRPQFIYEEALSDPAAALDLLEKEQLRLARRLPAYVDAIREGPGSAARERTTHVHAPFSAVVARIEQFQQELLRKPLQAEEMDRVTRLQGRMSLIVYLEDSFRALTAATERVSLEGTLGGIVSTFVEGLDFMMMTALAALEGNGDSLALLVQITGDRSALVERVRQEFVASPDVTPADRATLWQVTSIFERVVWMTQRLARLMDEARRATSGADSVSHAMVDYAASSAMLTRDV